MSRVTAPTNGDVVVVPAVLAYSYTFIREAMLTTLPLYAVASAIGSLYKDERLTSGAEAGCQGGRRGPRPMAAAGLAELRWR